MTSRSEQREQVADAVLRSWRGVDHDAGVGSELQYTVDGRCRMPGLLMQGREEIAAGYARRVADGPRLSRHLVSNLMVEVADDGHATASYTVTLYAAQGRPPLPLVAPSAVCDVVDRFLRIDGHHLIDDRVVTAVFVAPDNDSVLLGRGASGG